MKKNNPHSGIDKILIETIKKHYPSAKSDEQNFMLQGIQKLTTEKKLTGKDVLSYISSTDVTDELKRMERESNSRKIIQHLQMKFSRELKRLLGGDETLYSVSEKHLIPRYSADEKLEIVEGFIKIVKMKLENIHGEKIDEEYVKLQKKFRERFLSAPGLGYYTTDALMFKCVGNDQWDFYTGEEFNALPDAEAQMLTEPELKNFLKGILNLLHSEFSFLLRQPATQKSEQEETPLASPGDNYKVVWTGSETDKNEFVQLIYGLHHSKTLNDGKGEITKIIKTIARQWNLDLGKNWESTLSKSIHQRNSDYSPAIFTKISDAYFKNVNQKINKKKNM